MFAVINNNSFNPAEWATWLQAVNALLVTFVAVLAVAMHRAYAFTARGRHRQEVRRARRESYEKRRRERHERRTEDVLWEINREHAYELAVDLALNRAGGRVAVELARTARGERAKAHLQVVA